MVDPLQYSEHLILNFGIHASSICFDKNEIHVHCEFQNSDLNSESRFNQFKNS